MAKKKKETPDDYAKKVDAYFKGVKDYQKFIIFGVYATFFALWWGLAEDISSKGHVWAGLLLMGSATLFGLNELWVTFSLSLKVALNGIKQAKKKSEAYQAWRRFLVWIIIWVLTVGLGLLGIGIMAWELIKKLSCDF